jgi:hypothetical protein
MSRGFSRKALIKLKIAVFAPIPMASTATAAAVNPGFLARTRIPCRKIFILTSQVSRL